MTSEESSVGVEHPSSFNPPLGKVVEAGDCWFVHCLYCEVVHAEINRDLALLRFRNHARSTHYHYPSDMYLNKTDMAAAMEARRRYQSVMGTVSEGGVHVARQMNREGL